MYLCPLPVYRKQEEEQLSWLEGIGDPRPTPSSGEAPAKPSDKPPEEQVHRPVAAVPYKGKRKSAANPDAVKDRPSSPEDDDDPPDDEILIALENDDEDDRAASVGAADAAAECDTTPFTGADVAPRSRPSTRRSLHPDGGKKRPSAVASPMDVDTVNTDDDDKDAEIANASPEVHSSPGQRALPPKTPRQTTRSVAKGKDDYEDPELFPSSQKHSWTRP